MLSPLPPVGTPGCGEAARCPSGQGLRGPPSSLRATLGITDPQRTRRGEVQDALGGEGMGHPPALLRTNSPQHPLLPRQPQDTAGGSPCSIPGQRTGQAEPRDGT